MIRTGAGHRGHDRGGADHGAATVEFVTIGVLLLVPLVYLVIAMSRVQAASFAVDSSAREAARAFVTADNEEMGHRRAEVAVALGLYDQGFADPGAQPVTVSCDRTVCLDPGAEVTVEVTARVTLPGVPAFVDAAAVTIRATHVAVVDEFRAVDGG